MRLFKRVFELIILLIKKCTKHKRLRLDAPLRLYIISSKTELKCGNGGIMILGNICAETNVHLVAWGGQIGRAHV